MFLKLTELNGINFNASLYVYGFPAGTKVKFHALLKPELDLTKLKVNLINKKY